MSTTPAETSPHRARAALKAAMVAAIVLVVLIGALAIVDADAVYNLKRRLSLWLILAIVVIIDLLSFIVFALLFAAYKWIKRDLDPATDD
jgi:cytochrome bd-type quinol oxidase subunit 2